ncbi:hypothetical protein BpHYR1_007686 [Brachionus plicatilis]|uniref:Uncharacterized protein n=1 Tax=Brachionus plicatilis TaxID=10195 RepID=A0A3M7SPJ1_BRAPC|nr:hypothetical protein BpHYR1_007686 [Brachionus plicatilis]
MDDKKPDRFLNPDYCLSETDLLLEISSISSQVFRRFLNPLIECPHSFKDSSILKRHHHSSTKNPLFCSPFQLPCSNKNTCSHKKSNFEICVDITLTKLKYSQLWVLIPYFLHIVLKNWNGSTLSGKSELEFFR